MSVGAKKYRIMMRELDAVGIIVSIDRVARNKFTLLVNGEASKSFKVRHSCNRHIVKMHSRNVKK